MKHFSLSFYFYFFPHPIFCLHLCISNFSFLSLFFLSHPFRPACTLFNHPVSSVSHIQPRVPRVFHISRLAPQYDHANPPSRQLQNFTRDEFFCCDTFLLFFILLPLGYFYFGASAMIPTCPLLEIHDVTWAIRLIGVLRVVTILPSLSILSSIRLGYYETPFY